MLEVIKDFRFPEVPGFRTLWISIRQSDHDEPNVFVVTIMIWSKRLIQFKIRSKGLNRKMIEHMEIMEVSK